MESSRTPREWNANCATVKASHDGHYPAYWHEAIIASGLADKTLKAAGYPQGASIGVEFE
jgi:hypothetical protein